MTWRGSVPIAALLLPWLGGQEPVHISVLHHPRPVAALVEHIERRFQRVVTYEDARCVYPGDIVDITAETSRDPTNPRRLFGRRLGSLDLTYVPRTGPVERQVDDVLNVLVARANASGAFGGFRVEPVPGGHHVVPVAIKGRNGTTEPYVSLLDTRITLPQQEERGYEMLVRVTSAITAASGYTVNPGMMPTNRMLQARVVVAARDEPARDVLWRALQSIGPDLSWRLLCDVGERGECALNVHFVRE